MILKTISMSSDGHQTPDILARHTDLDITGLFSPLCLKIPPTMACMTANASLKLVLNSVGMYVPCLFLVCSVRGPVTTPQGKLEILFLTSLFFPFRFVSFLFSNQLDQQIYCYYYYYY